MLSHTTWNTISLSRAAKFQLKEETITDQNILQLKLHYSHEIDTIAFNKHEEGKNGADWESHLKYKIYE